MTRNEFFSRIDSMGIDRKYIALDRAFKEDAFNVVCKEGKWHVFWCEMGRGATGGMRFDTETDALEYLLARLSPNQSVDCKK